MINFPDHLSYGTRIFFASFKQRFSLKKYPGTAKEICTQIVNDCWNGHFFQTSTTNYSQFWTRDFGWCCKSLIKLGHKDKVHQTLRYALNRFQKYGKITTTISIRGKPFDIPRASVDSLPYLIHSIKISSLPLSNYTNFLNKQIQSFFEEIIDPETGLVRSDKKFSSMKDMSIRKSSCYDNVLVALLAKDLKTMNLKNPFQKYNYPQILYRNFWNGEFFYDDLTKLDYVASDANVLPFAFSLIQNKEMLNSSLQAIQKNRLDQPFPLRYTTEKAKVKFIWEEIFAKNYELSSIWTHIGPFYIKLLQQTNPELAKMHYQAYTQIIEKYGNYLEVFEVKKKEAKPFQSPFYFCDQGMLWAANYLTL